MQVQIAKRDAMYSTSELLAGWCLEHSYDQLNQTPVRDRATGSLWHAYAIFTAKGAAGAVAQS
jgi:hypothetical protein